MHAIKMLRVPACGFAKQLDHERRQLLAICGEFFSFKEGEVIVQEGESNSDLFLVIEGALMLRRQTADHSYVPLGTARRGSSFGEMNIFQPQPSRTTFIAIKDGVIWKISKVQLDAMLADDLIIAREVLSWLCQTLVRRLRRATERYLMTKGEYDHLVDEIESEGDAEEEQVPAEEDVEPTAPASAEDGAFAVAPAEAPLEGSAVVEGEGTEAERQPGVASSAGG